MRHQLAFGILATAGLLQAQTVTKIYYPNNVSSTGSCNVIPFGTGSSAIWTNQKYQMVVPASVFNKKVGKIQSLAVGVCRAGTRIFSQLTIRMDYFQGKNSTMSTTFASNISSKAVTVLDIKNHTWQMKAAQWNRIGLQRHFTYVPALGDLVIEITSRGSTGTSAGAVTGSGGTSGGTIPRLYATGSKWINGQPPATGSLGSSSGLKVELGFEAPGVDTFGVGCPGSTNVTPKISISGNAILSGKITIGMSGALPKAPAFFVAAPRGLPAPFDMGNIGAPKCLLYVPPDFLSTVVTNASGGHTQSVTLPKASIFLGVRLYGQYLPFDKKANLFGTSATDYARALLGK